MAIKAEGSPLSFSEIQSELGGSNPISLSEYYKNGSIINNDIHDPNGIPNSGNAISVFDFYRCARRQFAQWRGGNQSNPNGTVSGSFKTHVFTSSRGFNRTKAGIGSGRDKLHYIVIGGGGGGGTVTGGGGGAGDFMSGSFNTGNRTSYYMRIGGGGNAGASSGPSTRIVSSGSSGRGTASRIQASSSNGSQRFVTGIGGGGGMCFREPFYFQSTSTGYFANGGSGGGGCGTVDSHRGFQFGAGAGHDGGPGAEREETLCGGGGGGAGGAGIGGGGTVPGRDPGVNASRGGIGINITGFPGANGYRAGGGTGGGLRVNATRTPFAGGGGNGGAGPAIPSQSCGGSAGSGNKGAGGGGGGYNGNGVGGLGGTGGSGIIAVKYQFKA